MFMTVLPSDPDTGKIILLKFLITWITLELSKQNYLVNIYIGNFNQNVH